jgi:GT2 family glycosyltransferase
MQPAVTAIILNWNDAADTVRCLQSVYASDYGALRVLVVDNGSRDDSVAVIRRHYPHIDLIVNAENLGYAGGNNVGVERAIAQGADYVLILNDDLVVDPTMVSALVTAAQDHPEGGIFGPKVYSLDEPNVLLSTGAGLGRWSELTSLALGCVDDGRWDRMAEVDYLWGCAVLVSRRAIAKAGMLDVDFFAYHEDIDWCYRIRAAGYKVLFVPHAKSWHPDTRRWRQESALVTYYMSRNHLRLIAKHHLGTAEMLGSLATFVRRLVSWSVRPKWRHKRHQRDALARALLDFARGRSGRADHIH